jgi:CheY-like chemotaxis protein
MDELRILFVEDSPADVELVGWELEKNGIRISRQLRVQSWGELQRSLDSEDWDLVISDYSLPTFTGLEALSLVRRIRPSLPFIMVSGTTGEDVAAMVIKAGASEYLLKGQLHGLAPAVGKHLTPPGW